MEKSKQCTVQSFILHRLNTGDMLVPFPVTILPFLLLARNLLEALIPGIVN